MKKFVISLREDGEDVGIVTSGTLSPCLNVGIAMGYVTPDKREIGNILDILIREKSVKAKVIKPPFVAKDWAQKQEEVNV